MQGFSLAASLWLVFALAGTTTTPGGEKTDPAQGPTFRSGVDLVTVAAVVRDNKGRLVRELERDQFEVLDQGVRRVIAEFRPDQAPLTVALLFDASGSMRVASKMDAAKQAAAHVMAWLQPGRDEVALFSFDTSLDELQPFTTQEADLPRIAGGRRAVRDDVAPRRRRGDGAAGGRSAAGAHRAVIVLTDGIDTSSRLTAARGVGDRQPD